MAIKKWNFVQIDQASTQAALEQAKENLTRRASVDIIYISNGIGQQRIAKVIDFPVTFVKEPHMVSGCGTVKNPDPKRWHDPVGRAGVYAWKRDKSGKFIGAFIWVRVEMHKIESAYQSQYAQAVADIGPAGVKTAHFLTFSGTATKDVATPDNNELRTRTVAIAPISK